MISTTLGCLCVVLLYMHSIGQHQLINSLGENIAAATATDYTVRLHSTALCETLINRVSG
jgi:hypothetical protein